MANSDRPQGFKPYGEVKQAVKMKAGAVIRPGEFVSLSADGLCDPAAANADIFGLCLTNAEAANDTILVSIDPSQQYVGQADGSDIDAQTDIGQGVDILATADDTTYKASRQEIDSSSIGTGAQLIILEIEERPDNALGEFVDVRVKINENQIFGETDSAGI